MKKLFFSLITVIMVIGCSKKDYTCTCVVNGDEYKKTIAKSTHPKASSDCSDYEKAIGQSYYYGNYTYKCTVK